jgi:RND superfamily putative drug exporter
VIAGWTLILVAAVPLAGRLTGAQNDDNITYLPAGAESTEVLELQRELTGTPATPAVVVYHRPAGLTPADEALAGEDSRRFAAVDGVAGPVIGPVPADDGTALRVIVPVADGEGWEAIGVTVAGLREVVAAHEATGLTMYVTGPAGVLADTATAFAGIDSTLLYAALAVVVIILLVTYRSPVLWLLPVLTAGVALTVAQAVIYLLAGAGLTVNSQSAGILVVLVFGAGTDYALLLVARYREELRHHADRYRAMGVALRRAGPAIVASAGTVAAGMICLVVAQTAATAGMGPVAAAGVAVALLAMVTLLPALLVVAGRWVFWPLVPYPTAAGRPGVAATTAPSAPDVAATTFRSGPGAGPTARAGVPPTMGSSRFWSRLGDLIARRPRVVWLVTVAVLGVMTLGLSDLRAEGLPATDAFTTEPESVAGVAVLADHFPAGSAQPAVVVAAAGAAAAVRSAAAAVPGVAAVGEPTIAGARAYVDATLADAPDSPAALATVERLRTAVHRVDGADALVGGPTAIALDTADAAATDRARIIPLVLLVVLAILVVLLRAAVAPVLLVATVALSFGAALGISALVFNRVLGFAGSDPSLPLFVFVFLVALGVDYNIFLMTRVREEVRRVGARPAALIGLVATGGVITSAGLVLAGTFASLAVLPVIAFAQIGFAVALGVLLDAVIVRAVLVTALGLDLGRWMWWPGRLFRDAAGPTVRPAKPPA